MEKEYLTSLISRDLNDLRQLVDGFLQMSSYPEPLVQMAAEKAKELSDNLLKLNELNAVQEESAPMPTTPAVDESSNEPDVTVELVFEDDFEEEEELTSKTEEVVAVPEEVVVESVPDKVEEEPVQKESGETLFAKLLTDNVANTVGQMPIDDLSKAISLVDRFRFIRELFGGNGELMNTTIDDLNRCDTVAKANDYLVAHFPHWDTDNEAVAAFLSIVSRKYL